MRLKEPFYGLRVAGLHHIMHWGLLLAMIFLEANLDIGDIKTASESSAAEASKTKKRHLSAILEQPGIFY